ncbi:MAG TPA: hypothetical protein VIH31_01945 [Candidatus Paceibacterota bacterium]
MNTQVPLQLNKGLGFHVEPNIYIPVPGLVDPNDPKTKILMNKIKKEFDVTGDRIKVINLAELGPGKLFNFEGHFLDLLVATEVPKPKANMPVAKNEAA